MANHVSEYGFQAVPRDAAKILHGKENVVDPTPLAISRIEFPDTALVKAVHSYAKIELPSRTFNHSMRVYYYGIAIKKQQFPNWNVSDETYALCCLLHDIGTTPKNLRITLMSFEFYGGMLAHDLIHMTHGAPREQADSVAEAIIRHQDIGAVGNITTVGQLLQLSTVFDNMGINPNLIHKETIESVVQAHPRHKWSSCFASTIREENSLKPWAHSTALGEEDFPNGVKNNKLMEPYDA